MKDAGIEINYHHPEVAASGQFEIEPQLGEMSKMADATMWIKYIIHNTALKHGKTATFMPKPIYGEAGSGMHVHMLLLKDGAPLFADDNGYAKLSETAHYFMGGIDVDRYSKTSMDRLYAAGETACNGVHGRNRLASNSLLESLVFAGRAAHRIADGYTAVSAAEPEIDAAKYSNYREEYKNAVWAAIEKEKMSHE
jgi:hypothetical protein